MSRVTRGTPSGDAYLDLQNRARRFGRPTQELLQLYVLEGFLARLAVSDMRDRFVLKGGVLLAAFDSRRSTRDVDLAGLDIANHTEAVLELVRRILVVAPPSDDGIAFNVEAVLGGEPIELRGYPMHMIHAEKLVTAIQRGTANTRWRDFGDIWSLSRQHPVAADELTRAIAEVADHRKATIRPLARVLDGYAELGQARWVQWRRRSNSDHVPEQFATVLDAVIAFADPVLTAAAAGRTWNADIGAWE